MSNNKKKQIKINKKLKIIVFIGVVIILVSLIVGPKIGSQWLSLGGSLFGLLLITIFSLISPIKAFIEILNERKNGNLTNNVDDELTNKVINELQTQENSEILLLDNEKVIDKSSKSESDKIILSELESDKLVLSETESDKIVTSETEIDKIVSSESESHNIVLNENVSKVEVRKSKSLFINAPKRNKKIRLFFIFFALCLAVFVAGSVITSVSYVGFVLMGIGGGSFALFMIWILTLPVRQKNKYKRFLKIDKSLLVDFYDIKKGIVTACHMPNNVKSDKSNFFYTIWVCELNSEMEIPKGLKAPECNTFTQFYMLSQNYINDGTIVEFYQNKNKPMDCFFNRTINFN